MSLVLNLPPEAQERLRQKAAQTGMSAEEAVRKASEAVQQPTVGNGTSWMLLGLLLLALLLSKQTGQELPA